MSTQLIDDATREIESRMSGYRDSSQRQSEPEKDQYVYVEVPLELDVDQALRYVKDRWLANHDEASQFDSPQRRSLRSVTAETTPRGLSKDGTSPVKPRHQIPFGNTERGHRSTSDTATLRTSPSPSSTLTTRHRGRYNATEKSDDSGTHSALVAEGTNSADGTLIGQLVQLRERVMRSIDGTIVDMVGRDPAAGNNSDAGLDAVRVGAPRANSLNSLERRMFDAMQGTPSMSRMFGDATTQTSQAQTPLRLQNRARANADVITDGNVGDVIARDRSLYRNASVGDEQTTRNADQRKYSEVMGDEQGFKIVATDDPRQVSMNTGWNLVDQAVRLSAPETQSPLTRSSVDVNAVQLEMAGPGMSTAAYDGENNKDSSSSNGAWIQSVIRSAAAAAIGSTKRSVDVVDDVGVEMKSADDDESAGTTWLTARRVQSSVAVNDDRSRTRITSKRQNSERPLAKEDESQMKKIDNTNYDLEQVETCDADDDVDTASIHGRQRVFSRSAPADTVHTRQRHQESANHTETRMDSQSENEIRPRVQDVQSVTFSTQRDAPSRHPETQSKASADENRSEEVSSEDGITVDGRVDRKHRRRKHASTSRLSLTSPDGLSVVEPSEIKSKKKKHKRNSTVHRKSTRGGATQPKSASEDSENSDEDDESNDNDNQGHRSQHQNEKDNPRHRYGKHGKYGKHGNRDSAHTTHGGQKKTGNDRRQESETLNSDSSDEDSSEVANKCDSRQRRSSSRSNQMKVDGYHGWRTNIRGHSGKIPVQRASNQSAQTGNKYGRRNSPDSAAIAMIQQMPPPEEHLAERYEQRATGSRFNVAGKAGVYVPKILRPAAVLPGARLRNGSMVALRQPPGLVTPEATHQISGVVIDKRERFASGARGLTGATKFNIPAAVKRSALDEWNFRKVIATIIISCFFHIVCTLRSELCVTAEQSAPAFCKLNFTHCINVKLVVASALTVDIMYFSDGGLVSQVTQRLYLIALSSVIEFPCSRSKVRLPRD